MRKIIEIIIGASRHLPLPFLAIDHFLKLPDLKWTVIKERNTKKSLCKEPHFSIHFNWPPVESQL